MQDETGQSDNVASAGEKWPHGLALKTTVATITNLNRIKWTSIIPPSNQRSTDGGARHQHSCDWVRWGTARSLLVHYRLQSQ